jgi:hypothetical protein
MTWRFENHLIVAGVHRSGTTTLFNRLARHPEVDASRIKETNYFLPARYGRPLGSPSSYEEQFRFPLAAKLTLEASPGYYCGGEPVAEAISECLPKTRILVLLREPVERLESFYTFMKSILTVPRGMSLAEYVDACLALTPAELSSKELDMYRGLHDGLYADYYDGWRTRFEDSFRVYFLDDLSERPEETLAEIAVWAGISPEPLLEPLRADNRRSAYRIASLQRYARRFNAAYEPWLRRHARIKRLLRGAYRLVNGTPPAETLDEQVDAVTLERLASFYAKSNARLAQLVARDQPESGLPKWLHNEHENG